MEVAKCKGDLGRVKLSLFLGEALLLRKMFEELSALNEVHDKVDAVGLLEDVVHADDKGVVDLKQDQLLHLERVDRVVLYHDVFPDHFHGV